MEFWTYYKILRRRYRIVVATLLVGLVAGVILSWPRSKEYVATVTLTTSSPDESRYVLVLVTDQAQARPDATKSLAIELIRSRTVAERVVQRLSLSRDPQDLRWRLRVTRGEGDLINLMFRDTDPATAVLIANTYAEVAVAYNQEVNRREAALAREFIERELAATSLRLRQAEDALDEFKRQQGIVAIDTQVNAEVGHYIDLISQQRTASLTEREVGASIATLRRRLQEVAPTKTDQQLSENPVAQRLRGDLVNLEVQLAIARTTLTDNHPSVLSLNQRIGALKTMLEREVQRLVTTQFVQANPVYESTLRSLIDLETQRIALQAKQTALASILPSEQSKLPVLNTVGREFARLTRQVQVVEADYTNLQTRLNDFRIREQAAMNHNLVYIVDLAAAAQPAAPSRVVVQMLLAAMLGLSGGVGFVLFQHYVDNTVRTAKDAESIFGLPALSSIPKHNPPVEEAYRLLKTNMGLHTRNGRTRAIMFTSARSGSGTSTVVFHLAQTIARGGKRVIVVDADLRSPTVHRLFGVGETPGLEDVLLGSTDAAAVLQTSAAHVEVLPAGAPAGELADLFASPGMVRLLDDLRARADVILIDTPPVIPFAEVRALAAMVDGVVFIVAAGKASREINQEALRQLQRVPAHLLGIVMNMVASDQDEGAELYAAYPRPPMKSNLLPMTTALLLVMVLGGAGGVLIRSAPWLPEWLDRGSQLARSLLAKGL